MEDVTKEFSGSSFPGLQCSHGDGPSPTEPTTCSDASPSSLPGLPRLMESLMLLMVAIKKSVSSFPPEAFHNLKALVLGCVACMDRGKVSSVEQQRECSRLQTCLLNSLLQILRHLLKPTEDDIETLRDSVHSCVTHEDPVRTDLVQAGMPILKWYQHVVGKVFALLFYYALFISVC